ncbi:hypothetical protein CHUAL_001644 [Chamberlinius hualienensis]
MIMVPVELSFNVESWGMSEDVKFLHGSLSNSMYRPPNSGNFNIDIHRDSSGSFQSLILELGLKFGITLLTRVMCHSATCIDNVLVAFGSDNINGVLHWSISDHYLVFTLISERNDAVDTLKNHEISNFFRCINWPDFARIKTWSEVEIPDPHRQKGLFIDAFDHVILMADVSAAVYDEVTGHIVTYLTGGIVGNVPTVTILMSHTNVDILRAQMAEYFDVILDYSMLNKLSINFLGA